MGVADELRKTSKGKLQYTGELTPEHVQRLTDEVSAPLKLPFHHHESPTNHNDNRLIRSLQGQEEEQKKSKEEVVKVKVEVAPLVKQRVDAKGDNRNKPNLSSYMSPPKSPEYVRSCLEIRRCEDVWNMKAKNAVDNKIQEYTNNERKLKTMVERKAYELERQEQTALKHHYEKTAKQQLDGKTEAHKRTQEMKDFHKAQKKMQDEKLREGELKKKELQQEEERKRIETEKRRTVVKQYCGVIKQLHDKLMAEYDNCTCKNHIQEVKQNPRQMIGQLMTKAESILNEAEPSMKEVTTMKSLIDLAKNMYDYNHALIEEATKKARTEEAERTRQQQLQEQQKAAAEKAQAAAKAQAEQLAPKQSVIDEVVTEYEKYKAMLDNTLKQLAPFTGNTQMKKYRFELQKSVNTPINAISPVDGAHLRDKLQKLLHLLAGHQIEGKHVSAKDAPEGIAFCKNLVARMFVKKGEEQVSSKHESAFAIAMVAAGLWFEHSDLGDLMMAHFHAFCPYIVPIYFPKDPNMSSQEYHKLLGYKVDDDGTIEAQDKFLKRMSGLMRLYAAILVSSPPRANCQHPHGIEHAWIWLSRVLNMDPEPDITATLTYDLLQVTGHALYSMYKVQFVKLLYMLYKDFLPQLQKVAVAGGPVTRLKLFLEQSLNNFKMKQSMAPPEGYLQQNFWFT